MKRKLTLIHVISSLDVGGAEYMLFKLLSNADKERFNLKVITLTGGGRFILEIKKLGIEVIDLGMTRGVPNPFFIYRLRKILIKENPDIVQSWMYHADLICSIALLFTKIPLVWNIRHSNLNFKTNRLLTLITVRFLSLLSYFIPRKIVCCSEMAKKNHGAIGYTKKIDVVPNGFNLNIVENKSNYREELLIPAGVSIIGMAARYNSQKDYSNLITAAAMLLKEKENVKFLLCGEGVTWNNKDLLELISITEKKNSFILLGRIEDMSKFYHSIDLFTLSSSGEGFPNVLGEAMSYKVPCVATDVGDVKYIIEDTGITVPAGNPIALKIAWIKMLDNKDELKRLGGLARTRVEALFDIKKITNKYQNLYLDVAESYKEHS